MKANLAQQTRIFVFLRQLAYLHICNVEEELRPQLILSPMVKHLYIFLFALLSCVQSYGQGWERIYGGGGQDVARAISKTRDGGYILTGYYNGNIRLYLLKVDADGKLQWSKTFAGPQGNSRLEGYGVVATPDNGYAIVGYVDPDGIGTTFNRDIYLLKTDEFGNKEWDKTFGGNLADEARAITLLSDGCFVITGFQSFDNGDSENVFILKTDSQGNTLWFNNYGATGARKKGLAITQAQNGDLLVAGELKASNFNSKDAYVLRVGLSGNLIKEQTYEMEDMGVTGDDEARSIVSTDDGSFAVAGFSTIGPGGQGFVFKVDATLSSNPVWANLYPTSDFYGITRDKATGNLYASGIKTIGPLADLNIVKMDPVGQILWEAFVGRGGVDAGYAVLPTKDGAISAGFTEPTVGSLGDSYAYLVRTDSEGKVFTSYIEANVFWDFNNNCQRDIDEPGLSNWIVKIEGPYDLQYTVANSEGDLHAEVDTGTYNLIVFPPNTYWKSCDSIIQVQVPDFYDSVSVSVPVRTVFDCARNEVDIATPILRRCTNNVYNVRYCNSGTVPSLNTKIQVVLDPMLQYVSSSIPLSGLSGDTLSFNIGTLPNGDCRDFTITAFLDCDNTVAGQTHCVSAFISPNEFCDINTGWDGDIVAAKAVCENDTVKMVLTNIGTGNMPGPLGFVIAEDVVMLSPPGDPNFRFQLGAGQDTLVYTHPANGSTFRIIAQQSPGYPGNPYTTAAVEGCISDTSSLEPSKGFYTMFPEDDADAFKETDCQESQEANYNPTNLKRGHPKGYLTAQHYIDPQTDLNYLIRFRNDGADTVHQVIIRDTLSSALDPATVYPGTASHPYEFEVYGDGIVQFTLENANLVPGGGASEGFVSFRVAQKPNLPCGTIIFNSAAIYLDFNAPSKSNSTFHTICDLDSVLIITKTQDVYIPGAQVKTYPNPATDYVTFDITGVAAKQFTLQLYDIQGRLISNQFYNHPTFQLYRQQIPAGTTIYRLAADGKPLAAGKIIVR
ncbi:MAG: T9SS type A sorting domain-containing protein [Lewinellaceae bacterium]|nr:T9SS type A sorting domain-containing protein [Lewinellaceae bacterium]